MEKVLDRLPSGLFMVDQEQRIVFWNAAAERITGFSAKEAVGRHCSFLAGRRCGLFDPALPKPITGRSGSIRAKDGHLRFLVINVDDLRNGQGEVLGAIGSFVDITGRRRLEQRLRRHRSELGAEVRHRTAQLEQERSRIGDILDAMADFVYIAGPDFRIRFVNRAMAEVFSTAPGGSCHRAFHGLAEPCPNCPMERVLQSGTVREEGGFPNLRRTYESIHSPLRTAEGELQMLAVHRDITERKLSEKKLRDANSELDAFVYTVSHDLRGPLTPIIGFSEFLRAEYKECLDAQGIELLTEIENQGHKMLALMEDLLTLSRVGRITPPPAPASTRKVLLEVLDGISREINRTGIRIEAGPLPDLRVPETLLAQLFSNLIGNALCYAGIAGDPIEVGSVTTPGQVRLFVRDHGPGIPEEERLRIFDAFYRGTTSGNTAGTGIGLATVRKIVRLYDGRCWVEDTPGGGATFWIELPGEFGTEPATPPVAAPEQPAQ
jgi:PAS domain S-box-containing protein